MNRPWLIWTILGVCALLIMGAMAWSTWRVLELEDKQAQAESAGELEERVRLSLSRMDTAASSLLVLENQRPPHHFKAFFEPEDVFTNKFQIVSKGIVVQPSPLLSERPEFVRLHFEIDAQTREMRSPQVPIGNERDLAEGSGISGASLDAAASELRTLAGILAQPSQHGSAAGATKLDEICLTCAGVNSDSYLGWNAPPQEELQQLEASVAEVREGNSVKPERFQRDVTLIEKSKRAEVYNDLSQRALPRQVMKNTASQASEAPHEQDAAQAQGATVGGEQQLVALTTEVTPFQPVWLGSELIAVREVVVDGAIRYQGVWLEAAELSNYLVSTTADLLPHAGLERITEVSAATIPGAFALNLATLSNDPLSLVTLPWRLRPGEAPVAAAVGWSALRISLAVGWIALLLALLASAVLVRGVMRLSDRRATFVSSVTHELRTPLTTFQLYSDMLAEDMVTDERKKKAYLLTMRREAERLNHLVENVLAYSRVERGSARAERQQVSLGALLERMSPRLEERARKDEAELEVETNEEIDAVLIDTDLTAVEQIVFNLVDNACKYGLPTEGRRVVCLRSANGGGMARLEVCDQGGGISKADFKKLFRPFHKSARDAAHSKPGVGLGLALSRRLARELGGELRLDPNRGGGACFVLELPVAGKS